MNILKLRLKREWFDKIKSGVKVEEYREIKPHYCSRLIDKVNGVFRRYHAVEFTNGYRANSPKQTLLVKRIRIGDGKPDWGAPSEPVFIIELGEPALTVQDIKDMDIQITCANEVEFTDVKNTLIKAGLFEWLHPVGSNVIHVFPFLLNVFFMGETELDIDFGVVISAQEFLKRFVYE